MQEDQPVYSARHDRTFFQRINVGIAAGVIVFAVLTLNIVLFLLGIGIGLLYWFTTAIQYNIYRDSLVIHYGRPRIVVIPFDSVRDVSVVKVPLSSGVFVRRVGRAGVVIRPRGMEEFVARLLDAIRRHGGPALDGPSPEDGPPANQ